MWHFLIFVSCHCYSRFMITSKLWWKSCDCIINSTTSLFTCIQSTFLLLLLFLSIVVTALVVLVAIIMIVFNNGVAAAAVGVFFFSVETIFTLFTPFKCLFSNIFTNNIRKKVTDQYETRF